LLKKASYMLVFFAQAKRQKLVCSLMPRYDAAIQLHLLRDSPISKPRIIPRDEHHISCQNLPNSALKVLHSLNDAGFQAYLVGGCVRDMLLGMQPKDFDVATDATPEQVKSLFRNCRLIGRRFPLGPCDVWSRDD
jgi:hypothetical protein